MLQFTVNVIFNRLHSNKINEADIDSNRMPSLGLEDRVVYHEKNNSTSYGRNIS